VENIIKRAAKLKAGKKNGLKIVLKCDSAGSEEAVISSLRIALAPEARLQVIHSGVGDVSKSDLLLALTASRLVVGFNVGTAQRIEQQAKAQGIEIRLYDVIYRLTRDLQNMAASLLSDGDEEIVTGKAKVIARFKADKGIILGCRVLEGILALGKNFRLISAMGPIYTGKIESLQIENRPVKEAKVRQQAGVKISGLRRQVQIGDLVECFETLPDGRVKKWRPKGGVYKSPS